MEHIRVAALAEVPEGELRAYDTSFGRVAVAHVENRVFAVSDECTHAGCSLAEGELDDQSFEVECPCHGSVFDLENGEPVRGPAEDRLAVYSVRVEAEWVEVAPSEG